MRFERVLGTGCTFDEYLISIHSYSFEPINHKENVSNFYFIIVKV